jgi:hypothetical protein
MTTQQASATPLDLNTEQTHNISSTSKPQEEQSQETLIPPNEEVPIVVPHFEITVNEKTP